MNQGLPSHAPVLALAATFPEIVYAAAYDRVGVYKSDGGLGKWAPDNRGLPPVPSFALLLNQDTLWDGTAAGLFHRTANSQTWQRAEAIPAVAIYALARTDEGTLYAGTDTRGVFSSVDGGTTWLRLPGLDGEIILSVLGVDAQTIFAGTSGHGMLVTHDAGSTWASVADFQNAYVPLLTHDQGDRRTIYASTRRALMRSRDGGTSWETMRGGIETEEVYALLVAADRKHIFAGTASHGIFVSQDDGASWQPAGQPQNSGESARAPVPEGHAVLSFASAGDAIFAGTTDGVIRSMDQGSSWYPSDYREIEGIGLAQIHDLALNPADSRLFAVTEDGLYTRTGSVWKRFDAGTVDLPVLSVAIAPNDPRLIYAGTSHKGVFFSEDGGNTWTPAGGDLGGRASVAGLVVDPRNSQNVFARVLYERIYKSTDGGENWHTVWTGMPEVTEIETIAIDPLDPATMYAGGDDQLFYSKNGGETWVGGELQGVTTFLVLIDPRDSHKLIAGTTDGLYSTADGGKNWVRTGLEKITVTTLVRDSNGILYAGTKYNGVYASGDDGRTFARFGSGLNEASVIAMTVDQAHGIVYAATTSGIFCVTGENTPDSPAGAPPC